MRYFLEEQLQSIDFKDVNDHVDDRGGSDSVEVQTGILRCSEDFSVAMVSLLSARDDLGLDPLDLPDEIATIVLIGSIYAQVAEDN